MGRVERRLLVRLLGKSDVAPPLRFQAVALLGAGRSSPKVTEALHRARSTPIRVPVPPPPS